MNPALRALKNTVRKDMRQKLAALSTDEIKRQSSIVTEKLLNMPALKESQTVSVYISMHGEICTQDLIHALLIQKKACYVPRCHGKDMDMVKIESWEDFLALPKNSWNIPEPRIDEERENVLNTSRGLDFIVMPGLAFDRAGTRMGHGRGYYDNYLVKANNYNRSIGRPDVKTVALALTEQMVDEPLPRCETDINPQDILHP
ncbi:5-formyltetrahydrofolate cyclo-ligase [Entomortierella parvispora]|uniref:5-formyltetrahydrofolate cyclo-ligase n=1 Tax=Entomortierella parvispora TaxID=205924 RepID=A0A9P3M0K2_9FUNG|nr:5-formyltetrahydrofolate cyclo-ligase [Entomortierella parvispora]